MKRIKVEQYTVYAKGRNYEILKFPYIQYMWAFDDHPEEDMLMVDGCKEVFMWLKYAFAILANDDSKILYFPCKQHPGGEYYRENYHLVLCRPELQFRRSLWFRLKGKLDKKHYSGNYILRYDRKKLDDYYESGFGNKYTFEEHFKDGSKYLPFYLFQNKKRVEEIVGDTIFMVLPRIECVCNHYQTARDLDRYASGRFKMIWSAIGWIIPDEEIREMNREIQKGKKEQKKKWEEFREEIFIPELEE